MPSHVRGRFRNSWSGACWSCAQWGYSEGFDTYAPLGLALVSSQLITDPTTLHLQTMVNGEEPQNCDIFVCNEPLREVGFNWV